MKICTITCHRVYNYGASLQAFALQKFLENRGNEVEIIDYMPWYQQYRYNLFWLSKDEKSFKAKMMRAIPPLRFLLQPIRYLKAGIFTTWGRRSKFLKFEEDYLHITKRQYHNVEELRLVPPQAKVYIAGSDQIWNVALHNGWDPAHYLDFGEPSVFRMSYAASIGCNNISEEAKSYMESFITKLDAISIREKTGVAIVRKLTDKPVSEVVDPVFLLPKETWISLIGKCSRISSPERYLFLYDFLSKDDRIRKFTINVAKQHNLKILSVNDFHPCNYADININNAGPLEFLYYIFNSDYVISNSFHATAFAIIMNKEFYSFSLTNQDNSSRMYDLLTGLGLLTRYNPKAEDDNIVNWRDVSTLLDGRKEFSANFLIQSLNSHV